MGTSVKIKREFKITPDQHISIFTRHNGESWGKGLYSLLIHNKERPGIMEAEVIVYKKDGVLNSPIGGMQSWDVDRDYRPVVVEFKDEAGFIKITQEVEAKLLNYFAKQ